MAMFNQQWNQISCDRTFVGVAFSIAATASGRALYHGEAGLLTSQETSLLLATIVLLLLSFTPAYANGTRRWAVAAYRLLACALLPPGSGKSAAQLQHAAASPALDAVRMFVASRAIMLDMLSLGLPLDLPAHLAVQLPCLVLLLRRMHTCCDMPLLANPTQRGRIAALHAAAAGGAGLFVSPDQLLGGPRAQCTSLLAFLLLYCGGVLPTVAVMHWTWLSLRATAGFDMRRRHTEQHQEGISTPSSLGSVSSSRAGSSGALSAQSEAVGGSEAGSNEGMDLQAQAALIRGKPEGEAAPRCWLCTAAAAQHLPHWAVWLLEQAFPPVEGLPAAHACVYLPLLAAGCWLAACVLALATS